MMKSYYRADIDGLRAVAVVSVILFHFGVEEFSGGFVGVDVFFVISGFLITRLIQDELAAGNFSLVNFYLRRARRLFPALFITLIVCFAYAFHVFSAEHFERFGGALFYAVLSISNIFFWNEQGYFDTDAVFKPLLHTWSLSVEEQFYLIWPSLIVLFSSVKYRFLLPIMISIIGFISLYAAQSYMATDANAVFFLTPFRMVEFSIGAICVWVVKHRTQYALLEELVLLSGLVFIGIAVICFDSHTSFPGYNALLPCIGTALVIYAGRAKYSGKLLCNPVAVKIGLISYSVYLIHWPVYVFYQYPNAHSLNTSETILLFAATLLLASMMYFLIETPFRRLKVVRHQLSATGFAIGCMLFALATTLPAAHVWKYEGWPWRLTDQQNPISMTYSNHLSEMQKRFVYININQDCINTLSEQCTSSDRINGLVIGDSHAIDGYNALTIASKGGHRLSMLSLAGCQPVVNPDQQIPARWPLRKKCLETNKRWFNPKTYEGFDYLVISSLLGNYFRSPELKQFLQFIKSETHIKHIIVFGNYIRLSQPLHSLIQNGDTLLETVMQNIVSAFGENVEIKKICEELQCLFIDKKDLFCKNKQINACTLTQKGIPFTWDRHHLTLEFSSLLGRLGASKIKHYLSEITVH